MALNIPLIVGLAILFVSGCWLFIRAYRKLRFLDDD